MKFLNIAWCKGYFPYHSYEFLIMFFILVRKLYRNWYTDASIGRWIVASKWHNEVIVVFIINIYFLQKTNLVQISVSQASETI